MGNFNVPCLESSSVCSMGSLPIDISSGRPSVGCVWYRCLAYRGICFLEGCSFDEGYVHAASNKKRGCRSSPQERPRVFFLDASPYGQSLAVCPSGWGFGLLELHWGFDLCVCGTVDFE